MIGAKQFRQLPAASAGFVWPKSGTATPDQIDSPFGNRRFPPYITVTGYDYDMHRGQDIRITQGNPVYAVIAGVAARAMQSFYGWESARQRSVYWATSGTANATFVQTAPSTLTVTGTRSGAQAFPVCALLLPTKLYNLIDPTTARWEFRLAFTSIPAAVGGVLGMGMYDPLTNERIILEYDGTTLTVNAVGSGGPMASNGTATAVAAKYLDIYYDFTSTINFRWTNDPTNVTWTTFATQAGFSGLITNKNRSCWKPVLYWRSTDTNAAVQTFLVDYFAFWDGVYSVPKFGNWNQNMNNLKVGQYHAQELLVEPGDVIEAGQLIALAGDTGMDEYSGLNGNSHCHMEYCPTPIFDYGDYQGYNPQQIMTPASNGVMPRNPPTSIACTLTSMLNPDGAASWRVEWTLQRGDQAFDLNEVTFTGSVASRRRNYNTGVGEDPVNFRTPKYDGMISYANTFDQTSTQLVAGIYFAHATVGAGTPSLIVISNANGTTIATCTAGVWSYP